MYRIFSFILLFLVGTLAIGLGYAPLTHLYGGDSQSEFLSGTPIPIIVQESILSHPIAEASDKNITLNKTEVPIDCSKLKCVALTFDDGPSKFTKQLLQTLKKQQVHATFFVVGGLLDTHKEILKEIASEGHQIGNHTWNHKLLTKLTPEERTREVENTSKKIEEITGIKPTLLRPPYGGVDESLQKELGYAFILWDKDSLDWKRKKVETIVANATYQVKAGDIILMHDIYQRSVDAVPTIIKKLKKEGFTLVTIDDLFGTGGLEIGVKYNRRKY